MKNAGIMNLLIFSIPAEMPKTRMTTVRPMAMRCQGMEPKETARPSKKLWAFPARIEPEIAPAVYRRPQPTTTEYPMAMPSTPRRGMTPMSFPPRFPRDLRA